MASGVLTVIGCPILEDELIYSILEDEEDKDIYLVKTEPSKSLKKKLKLYNMPFGSIDGQDFTNRMETFDPSRYSIVIKMLDMGLHREPNNLRAKVEEEVTLASNASDVIALYYGTCGNFGWDVSEWAKEKGLCPVVVFRDVNDKVCDDCVGVAVGGTDNYLKLLKAHTGHMLFTPSIAINWNDFLEANNMFKGFPEKSVENLKWLFEQCNYDSVLEIDTGLGDSHEMRKAIKEFAETYDFKIVKADGHWTDLYPAKRIYQDAKQLLKV